MADPRQNDPLELSAAETQVMLGRFAGATIDDLARSTGMPAEKVAGIVAHLARIGLLEDDAADFTPTPPPDRVVSAAPPPPARVSARPASAPPPPARVSARPAPAPEPAAELHAEDDLVALLDAATFDLLPPGPAAPAAPSPQGPRPPRMTPAMRRRLEEPEDEPTPSIPPASQPADEAPPPSAEDEEVERAEREDDTREYRKLYETKLRPLPIDERAALAGVATGAELFALCFDPVPEVIAAMFENSATTVDHARLIAFHHRDPRGLDQIASRPRLASDGLVHRRLVRNPAVTDPMIRRLLSGRRLLEIHKATIDRDVPERSRVAARHVLRTRWMSAQGDERAELVWATEGRVLSQLAGLTFDSRSTSMLCSRNYSSVVLVQALARFPATPPALLAHLLRQPLVKRQQQLRMAILQHPNTASEAKRRS